MYELEIFGESHEDPATIECVTQSLRMFKGSGYNTLFLEMSGNDTKDQKSLKAYTNYLDLWAGIVKYFINGKIPDSLNELTTEQYTLFYCWADSGKERDQKHFLEFKVYALKEYDFHKNRLRYLESRKLLITEALKLPMNVVGVDVDSPLEYEGVRLQERREVMLNSIEQYFSSSKNSKGILIIGACHLLDVWEKGYYNRGLIRMILRKNFQLKSPYFIYFDKSSSAINDFHGLAAVCSPNISSLVQEKCVKEQESFQSIIAEIRGNLEKTCLEEPAKGDNEKCKIILNIEKEGGSRIYLYLEDLGAKILNIEKQRCTIEINASFLTPARCSILGIASPQRLVSSSKSSLFSSSFDLMKAIYPIIGNKGSYFESFLKAIDNKQYGRALRGACNIKPSDVHAGVAFELIKILVINREQLNMDINEEASGKNAFYYADSHKNECLREFLKENGAKMPEGKGVGMVLQSSN